MDFCIFKPALSAFCNLKRPETLQSIFQKRIFSAALCLHCASAVNGVCIIAGRRNLLNKSTMSQHAFEFRQKKESIHRTNLPFMAACHRSHKNLPPRQQNFISEANENNYSYR
jgi:hypothetical protein